MIDLYKRNRISCTESLMIEAFLFGCLTLERIYDQKLPCLKIQLRFMTYDQSKPTGQTLVGIDQMKGGIHCDVQTIDNYHYGCDAHYCLICYGGDCG